MKTVASVNAITPKERASLAKVASKYILIVEITQAEQHC